MRHHLVLGLIAALLGGLIAASAGNRAVQSPVASAGADRSAQSLAWSPPVPLSPEVASYSIQATLAADGAAMRGSEVLRYRNPSPDTLGEVYLHLYLNAFRSEDTVWMREARRQHRGFVFSSAAPGWIRVESIASGDQPLSLEPEPDETIARVPLARPLPPGEELSLSITWTAQLPRVFARTGWAPGGFTMVGQWYPKLAVYDPRRGGWDREPWHANAEFFHDFGNYDLTLTVPAERSTVVANGEPDGRPEDNGDGTLTWRFKAQSVSDVVWMAAERFSVQSRPVEQGVIEVALPAEYAAQGARHLDIAEYALRYYGEWLGPYPWRRLSIVVPPANAAGAGGMEYPALVTSVLVPPWLPEGIRLPELATAHEVAHQWFPMQVATNEARDPWMDEGFADYLTERLLAGRYGRDRSTLDLPFVRVGYQSLLRSEFSMAVRMPITLPSWEYTGAQYGAAVYGKGALFLGTLERVFDRARFTAALHGYVDEWRWRHPLPADFEAALNARLGTPEAETAPGGVVDPWFDRLAFGERVLDVGVPEVSAAQAVVERTGDAALPVDGLLTLESGRSEPWRLAAEATRLELTSPAGERIAAVVADAEQKLVIQPNRLDDGMTAQSQVSLLSGVLARWMEALALLLQSVGQFG